MGIFVMIGFILISLIIGFVIKFYAKDKKIGFKILFGIFISLGLMYAIGWCILIIFKY